MATAVSPTSTKIQHHITLTDGSTVVGFVPFNPSTGQPDVQVVRPVPLSRTALKTSQGETQYEDGEMPYMSKAQDDWTGGRGSSIFENDTSRYADGYLATIQSDGVLLGGLAAYTTGNRGCEQYWPGTDPVYTRNYAFVEIYGTRRYYSTRFISSTGFNAKNVSVWARAHGSPGTLTATLYSDEIGTGKPNAVLATASFSAVNPTIVSQLYKATFASAYTLVATTAYHLVISCSASDDATDHWDILCDGADLWLGWESAEAVNWSSGNYAVYFRFTDADVNVRYKFFEYKRGFYAVSQPESGGTSTLYINGDRGVADSNAGDKTYLEDATKSWTTDEFAGCKVVITKGTGSTEATPWRAIVANDSNSLQVSPDWEITHDTTTEYVILGQNKWRSLSGSVSLGGYVTDVVVADEYVYFARGDSTAILRLREWNNGGTWTYTTEAENWNATHLLAIRDPASGQKLFGGMNAHSFFGSAVWAASVPGKPGKLYHEIVELAPTDRPWSSRAVSNVTNAMTGLSTSVDVAAGFSTGIAAVLNLTEAVNLMNVKYLGVNVKSTVTTASGDVKLILSDKKNLGRPAAMTFYNGTTHAGMYAGYDTLTTTNYALTMTATDFIYIMGDSQFNLVYVDMGTTVNSVASVMSATYWDGDGWTALTIVDNTATAGATLAKDGEINFTPPSDWSTKEEVIGTSVYEGYWIRLAVSVNLTASININEVALTRRDVAALSFPILTANQWQSVQLAVTPLEDGMLNYGNIQSVGLRVDVDNGAQIVYLNGGVKALSDTQQFAQLPGEARVNNLEVYGGSASDPRQNPWVFTENQVYEVQTQNGNVAIPLPLKEIVALRSEINGVATTTNDVYLFFNLGNKIQRYFNRNMDDIGPDLDSGLPKDRQGQPTAMATYAGRVYLALSNNRFDTNSATSSVLVLRGSAWHEMYRSPTTGVPIYDLAIQSIPGTDQARLWVAEGGDLLWVAISPNPDKTNSFPYGHEAHVITSKLYGGMRDIIKAYKSLKVFFERSSNSTNINIVGDYRVDGASEWTEIGTYDTLPVEEINLSTASPPNVRGKYIEFRLRLYTDHIYYSPKLTSLVAEMYGIVAGKYGYSWTAKLTEDNYTVNLDTKEEKALGYGDRVETAYNLLVGWFNTATPLIMNSSMEVLDNKTVVLEAPVIVPIDVDFMNQVETHLLQVTCHDL